MAASFAEPIQPVWCVAKPPAIAKVRDFRRGLRPRKLADPTIPLKDC